MTLFTDISELYNVSYISGIQRVMIEVMTRWIDAGEVVELGVYSAEKDAYELADNHKFRDYYKHSSGRKDYLSGRSLPVSAMDREYVFFDMDSSWVNLNKRSYLLPRLRAQGVGLAAHIYDVIPATHPQYCHELTVLYFMDYLTAHLQNSDLLISNAHATVRSIRDLTAGLETHFSTAVVKLGSDISDGRGDNSGEKDIPAGIRAIINAKPYILMVGTLEPRKNHAYVLDAFDKKLFDDGCNLVFAGRRGWNIGPFMNRVENHPLYNKQLFMAEGPTDREIEFLYRNAFFVAFASFNEGFGLPVIESLYHGTPVLAADIPVLRETGGEFADYFSLDDTDDFVRIVEKYSGDVSAYERKKADICEFRHADWDECAARMLDEIKRKFI